MMQRRLKSLQNVAFIQGILCGVLLCKADLERLLLESKRQWRVTTLFLEIRWPQLFLSLQSTQSFQIEARLSQKNVWLPTILFLVGNLY